MDIGTIITPIVSAVVSIGAVSVALKGFLPKIVPAVILVKDSILALDQAVEALEDGELSASELQDFKVKVENIKKDWAAITKPK